MPPGASRVRPAGVARFTTMMPTSPPERVERDSTLSGAISDEQVVERILAGDRSQFELIMRRYNQRLYRVVRGILGREVDIEDALQDAYLNAYTNLHQFREDAKFSTWLTRIAVHGALRRRRGNGAMSSIDSWEDADRLPRVDRPEHSPEDWLERSEFRNVLTELIDSLPTSLRTVVMLRDIEGMSTREAADCLETSEGNVRIRLHRAREILRSEFDRRLGDEACQLYTFGEKRCDRLVANVMQVVMK